MVVEIHVDELHGERPPTRDELERWFVENYHGGNIEFHAEYIREQLRAI